MAAMALHGSKKAVILWPYFPQSWQDSGHVVKPCSAKAMYELRRELRRYCVVAEQPHKILRMKKDHPVWVYRPHLGRYLAKKQNRSQIGLIVGVAVTGSEQLIIRCNKEFNEPVRDIHPFQPGVQPQEVSTIQLHTTILDGIAKIFTDAIGTEKLRKSSMKVFQEMLSGGIAHSVVSYNQLKHDKGLPELILENTEKAVGRLSQIIDSHLIGGFLKKQKKGKEFSEHNKGDGLGSEGAKDAMEKMRQLIVDEASMREPFLFVPVADNWNSCVPAVRIELPTNSPLTYDVSTRQPRRTSKKMVCSTGGRNIIMEQLASWIANMELLNK